MKGRQSALADLVNAVRQFVGYRVRRVLSAYPLVELSGLALPNRDRNRQIGGPAALPLQPVLMCRACRQARLVFWRSPRPMTGGPLRDAGVHSNNREGLSPVSIGTKGKTRHLAGAGLNCLGRITPP